MQNICIYFKLNLFKFRCKLHKFFLWKIVALLFVECLSNNYIILFNFIGFINLIKLSQLRNLLLPVATCSYLLKRVGYWSLHSDCSDLCRSNNWFHLNVILIVFKLVLIFLALLCVNWLKFVHISSFYFGLYFIILLFGRWALDLFLYVKLIVQCGSFNLDPVVALLVISL